MSLIKDPDLTPQENEQLFQKSLNNYRNTNSKKDWDTMWMCVHFCCSNIAKKKLANVKCRDFDDKVCEATLRVMNKIKEGTDPEKLSSFTYLYVIGVIYDRKAQKYERDVSWEDWNDYQYAKENIDD